MEGFKDTSLWQEAFNKIPYPESFTKKPDRYPEDQVKAAEG